MKRTIGFFASLTIFTISCNNTQHEQPNQNQSLPQQVVDTVKQAEVIKDSCAAYLKAAQQADNKLLTATVFNQMDAENALKAFDIYTNYCYKDSLAPIYLLKGGQVAQSIKRYSTAQVMFKRCVDAYPKFANRGAAMFLLAQLFDDAKMLNDETQAKILYQQIIKEYPKTNFAEDAKMCLKNIGKTDEQIIEEFMKKNK